MVGFDPVKPDSCCRSPQSRPGRLYKPHVMFSMPAANDMLFTACQEPLRCELPQSSQAS